MIAAGALLFSFPDENDMKGTIEVKDFKVVASNNPVATSKLKSVKGLKKAVKASTKKVKGAKVKKTYCKD